MTTYLLALGSIAISVLAQFTLKTGMSAPAIKSIVGRRLDLSMIFTIITEPYVMLGFILYGLGAAVWLAVLSEWDVSKAYPLVGAGFALSALVGYLLGEHISLQRMMGVFLICSGVWVVART
jgi:multidrug transporter EmrE-like cation transporter